MATNKVIKKSQFLDDVAHEVKMLKIHATKKELANLDFNTLDYDHPFRCIYGQMTKSCSSKRAKELMGKCCIRIFSAKEGVKDGIAVLEKKNFSDIKHLINGKNEGQTWLNENFTLSSRSYIYLSALEGYISLKGARNKHIIKYLKGEISELKLY